MLGDKDVCAVLAVRDLGAAKSFYEGTLGLKKTHEDEEMVMYKSGNSMLSVYRSQFAGTNKATAASWKAEDVASVVKELKSKGVNFEHYDMPGSTLQGDIHVMGDMQAVWFKDPDGNILCITNMG